MRGGLARATGLLAAMFAVVGVVVALLGATIAGRFPIDPLPIVVLAGALTLAGAIIAVIAWLADWWLVPKIPDDERRLATATVLAAGFVLLSGLMSVGSLGILAFAVTAMLAVLTQQVLYRTLR